MAYQNQPFSTQIALADDLFDVFEEVDFDMDQSDVNPVGMEQTEPSGLLINHLGLGGRPAVQERLEGTGRGNGGQAVRWGGGGHGIGLRSGARGPAAGDGSESGVGRGSASFQRYDSGIVIDDSPNQPDEAWISDLPAEVECITIDDDDEDEAASEDLDFDFAESDQEEQGGMAEADDGTGTGSSKVQGTGKGIQHGSPDSSWPDDLFPNDTDDEFFGDPMVWVECSATTQSSNLDGAAATSRPVPKLKPWKARLKSGTDIVKSENLIIEQDLSMKDCRVYRRFPADRFLWAEIPELHVKHDGGKRIPRWCDLVVYHRVSSVGGAGAGTGVIGNKTKFTFLCSSESRLKSRGICFFAPYQDETTGQMVTHMDILGAFGDLESVYLNYGIGKYFARLSLSFSETRESIKLRPDQIVYIPDHYVKDHPDGIAKAYTDGCGIITEEAAREVQLVLGIDYLPSAFQIRLGGCKGMLVVWPDKVIELSAGKVKYNKHAAIYIRDSQYKYSCPEWTVLEINNFSPARFKPARLQRSFVRILCALGVDVRKIEALLRKELARLDSCISDVASAIKFLEDMGADVSVAANDGKTRVLLMLKAGHKVEDPCVRHELRTLQRYCMERLREKLAIPVPNSTMLLGVVDETGSLLEDEVTAYVSGIGYLEGRILVTRSPCSHPGDVRVMRAIRPIHGSAPRDCLIFSRAGLQPTPDKISGGDLDGDLYFVSWDQSIIPPRSDNPNPRPPRVTRAPEARSMANLAPDLKRHVKQTLRNVEIGATSNAFEECEEIAEAGARDPQCLALSERYELALDAAKGHLRLPPMPKAVPAGRLRPQGPVGYLRACIPDLENGGGRQECAGPDHDLEYQRKSRPLTISAAAPIFEKLKAEYVTAMRGERIRMIGPNQPLNENIANFESGLTLAQRLQFSSFCESKLSAMREENFPRTDIDDLPDHWQLASRLYVIGYSSGSTLDASTMKIAWLGFEHLNFLKSKRIADGSGLPLVCIAPNRPSKPSAAKDGARDEE